MGMANVDYGGCELPIGERPERSLNLSLSFLSCEKSRQRERETGMTRKKREREVVTWDPALLRLSASPSPFPSFTLNSHSIFFYIDNGMWSNN